MRRRTMYLIGVGTTVAVAAGAAGFALGHSGVRNTAAAATTTTTAPSDTPTTGVPVSSDTKSSSAGSKAKASAGFTTTSATPPAVIPPPGLRALECPPATVTVHDGPGLQAALDAARAGAVIQLADGIYGGRFSATGAATQGSPIWVCGGPMAIIDDGHEAKGAAAAKGSGNYGFHLTGASWWNLIGFSIRNAQKGIVLDHSTHNVLHGLTVYNIGDEAIHLREFSTDNVVEGCIVRNTGLRVSKFGEGIYLGTAVKNWPSYTSGQPDASDRNIVRYNDIAETTAENVDVKEGTNGGEIAFNHFDGTGLVASAASSWVNVKGNGYSVHDNSGQTSLGDGFSTHEITRGSGSDNTFSGNHIGAGVTGYGFAFHSTPNTLRCDNTGQGSKGLANVSCSS